MNHIKMFYHCGKCLDRLPPGKSPQQWAKLEVGATDRGVQVWCKRHQINVIHIDFEGVQHAADTSIKGDFDVTVS